MQNNEYWLTPPIEKVYEALTAIADSRIEPSEDKLAAKLYSSSGNKFYTINYDPQNRQIMSDDNSAFYTDQISYPMIALLMLSGEINYNESLLEPMRAIKWKDINQKHKNNYAAAVEEVLECLATKGVDNDWIRSEVVGIYNQVKELKLKKLGTKKRPSKAY